MTDADPPDGPSLPRRRVAIGLGLLGAGAAGGGYAAWRSRPAGRSVAVGGTLPLSGPLEPIGGPLRRGLALWVARANATGGLLGRNVSLEIVDDGGRPDAARDAYRSLVDGSDLLVAPYGSPMTSAVIEVVEAAGVPCVAHTAGDRGLWADGRTWTVQLLNPVDTVLHPPLAAAFRAGARSVSFVFRDDAFTPATMAGARAAASRRGWTVRDARPYGSADGRRAQLERVLRDPPDLVVGGGFIPGAAGGGFLPDALALSRAYERAGGGAKLVCWSIGASFPGYAEALGGRAALSTGTTGWKPYVGYPGSGAFVERYADQWGTAPDAHAAQGYATGQLLAAAVEAAGSLDRRPVRDALFALRTETVFGRYEVDRRGLQVGNANAAVQWQDGRPVVVAPDRWRTGELVYPAGPG